jgi:hypothetical protein
VIFSALLVNVSNIYTNVRATAFHSRIQPKPFAEVCAFINTISPTTFEMQAMIMMNRRTETEKTVLDAIDPEAISVFMN